MKTRLLLAALLCLALWLSAQQTPLQPAQGLISVSVTGFVAKPGSYQVSPLTRLADALSLAQSVPAEPLAPEMLTPRLQEAAARDSLREQYQALRSVKLLRDGQIRRCDLLRFLRLGDLGQNPLLRDGDVVVIGAVQSSVSLSGEVYQPGEYEFVAGDRLSDLLELAQGFTLNADAGGILIYRYRENRTDFDLIRIDLQTQAPVSVALQADDRVIISKNAEQRRAWKVKVEGEVKAPGEYLVDGRTSLYELLQQCGGPTISGDLQNAFLATDILGLDTDPDFERLKDLAPTEMTTLEYHYLRNRLRQYPGRYSVDVSAVWDNRGGVQNVALQDGDYLYVPQKMDVVEVSGQVMKPGLVAWVEGKTWEYYVDAAGGYTNNKRWKGVRIISASSGNWVRPTKKVPINPGDNIFVAERTERDFWSDVKDVLLITSQVVTIFLGVRAITTN